MDIDALPKSKDPCPYSSEIKIIPKIFIETNLSLGFFEFFAGIAIEFEDYVPDVEIYGSPSADIFNSDDYVGSSKIAGISIGGAIEGEGITVSRRDEFMD